jgi:hypothetical protein
MDLATDLGRRHAARQMRASLLAYMAGDRFDPRVELDPGAVRALVRPPSNLERLGATIRADSAAPGHPVEAAIDGNPATIWHTPWDGPPSPHPHRLVLGLGGAHRVRGLTYTPRQEQANGRIGRYAIRVSPDGEAWETCASGTWPDGADPQTVTFERTRTGRYVMLESLTEVHGHPYASVAEVELAVE